MNMPSGFNPDTGEILNAAINPGRELRFLSGETADCTVCLLSSGAINDGERYAVDIGVFRDITQRSYERD